MMERRLLLVALCFATAASIPSRAAQPPDVMTWIPTGAMLAALDLGQTVPDTACVAKCAATRDRGKAEADRMLTQRRYYSEGQSNCWSLSGAPQCAAIRQACRDACKPNYTNACMAACEPAFQSCCAANDKTRAEREYTSCVAQCPAGKPPVLPEPPTPTTAGALGKGATVDKKTEWASMLTSMNTMLNALGPRLEGLDMDRFNDLRRSLAFMQVRAALASNGRKFAVVAGGDGRLWLVLANGRQVAISSSLGASIRTGGRSAGSTVMLHELGHSVRSTALDDLAIQSGLSATELNFAMDDVRDATRSGFSPGDVLYFPDIPAGTTVASSEHSSIRGTINGGGDFI